MFPSTHWSLVDRAGRAPDGSDRREALANLLHRYLPALRCHLIYTRRLDTQTADDLLQAFLADKILEQNTLRHAEQSRGRFRGFLVTALDHFVSNHARAQR
ncbi:MAG: hypothetical protein ACREIT_06850, partial [Tepidisphaeraceae bacterium]